MSILKTLSVSFVALCITTTAVFADSVVHVGFIWLKEPGNKAHRAALIEATRGLDTIPGVIDIRVGEAIASERAIVDDSFDVGLYVTLESREALAAYLPHPVHQQLVKDVLKPLAAKLLIYDFDDAE